MCYESRFPPRDLLKPSDREVKGQTLGITRGLRILESLGSPLVCAMSGLVNDPYLCIMLHMMKAQNSLVSHQRDNATRDPSYLMRYVQGWDHKHLVKIGHLRPRPGRRILTPQSHPSHGAIPHTKYYNKPEEIYQMNPPSPLGLH